MRIYDRDALVGRLDGPLKADPTDMVRSTWSGFDGGSGFDGSSVDGSHPDAGGVDAEAGQALSFPFAMTFENGSLFGDQGANVAPTMMVLGGAGALFGKFSASGLQDNAVATVTRTFAPQPNAFFAFYRKLGQGAGGVFMRLDGPAGPLVEIIANPGSSVGMIAYDARILGVLTSLGGERLATEVQRFGVSCKTNGNDSVFAVYRKVATPAAPFSAVLAGGTLPEGGAPIAITLGNIDSAGAVQITIDEVHGTFVAFAPTAM